jgi:transcriptional regulator NrdR family protein
VARKPKTVYLAGPINNCNHAQIHHWRDTLKEHWAGEFRLIDPSEFIVDPGSSFDIVHQDLKAIRESDAVLANVWKESLGTALGVAHAARHGKPIFIVDPNDIDSRAIAYFALVVVRTPNEGMRRVREFFRAQEQIRTVVKRDGREEPFDRQKLVNSLRQACRDADQDDLLPPTRITPRVVASLIRQKRTPGKGKITSSAIRDAVWEVLRDLEADPLRGGLFAGIRECWEDHERARQDGGVLSRSSDAVTVHPRPLEVRVFSGKAHSSIWGAAVKSLAAIPGDARAFFEEICRVEGIAEVRLTGKSNTRTKWAEGVRGEIFASREPHIIEGKCYDHGRAGEVQMFQIRVHDKARKEAIRRRLMDHLRTASFLRAPAPEEE